MFLCYNVVRKLIDEDSSVIIKSTSSKRLL